MPFAQNALGEPGPYKRPHWPAKLIAMEFRFEVLKTDSMCARLGRLTTPHGVVDTPAFLPEAHPKFEERLLTGFLIVWCFEAHSISVFHPLSRFS
jgi:hypothetical protein